MDQFFADWLWSVILEALGLKTTPDVRNKNSSQTSIAYAHLNCNAHL